MDFLVSKVFRRSSADDVRRFYLEAVFQQRIAKHPPQLSPQAALAMARSEEGAIALVELDAIDERSSLNIVPIEED